jgi:hypothetical protein
VKILAIGVATMRRPFFVKSLRPGQLSSAAICRLTAPWVTPSCVARVGVTTGSSGDLKYPQHVERRQATHQFRE